MKILCLATDAFGGQGGIAKFNRDFLKALCANADIDEIVVVPRRMLYPPEPLPPKITHIVSGLNSKWLYLKTLLNLWRGNRHFDIVFCAHIHLLSIAYALKLLYKANLILSIHGIDAWQPTKRWLSNYLIGTVDVIIVVSEVTKQRFLKWAKIKQSKIFILPNAVNLAEYGPGPKNAALLNRYGLTGKVVLMTLGRLASQEQYKGIDEIMEALPALIARIPDIAYLIVGDGDDRPRLEEKAKKLGVWDRVMFTGFIPETEKADHYRLADAFVMPGRGEGFGIVFLEALACGVPAVGSKLDGSREALRGGALGILVDPRRPEEIEAGVLKALEQPLGVIPPGLDYFSFENFAARCHEILRQIATPGKSAGRLK